MPASIFRGIVMKTETEKPISVVFDYLALRLLVGLIAMAMPIVVSLFAADYLPSISASYHTKSRDLFVGMLFVIGVFLFAYKGHDKYQSWAANIAAIAAIIAAIFPTSCEGTKCLPYLTIIDPATASEIHNYAAIILFIVLAYFCLGPFRKKAREKGPKGKVRSIIYIICGGVISGCILTIIIFAKAFPNQTEELRIIYWGEFLALIMFGIAWFVAGKWYRLTILVDENDETYRPWGKKNKKLLKGK